MQTSNSDFNKNYFKILQIDQNASIEVIKAAYRALVKKYHPDTNQNINEEKIKEVNEAYEVLINEDKKKEYLKYYKPIQTDSINQASYLSTRYDFKRREQELLKKEEELKTREMKIALKMKLLDEIKKFSNNSEKNIEEIINSSDIITDFMNAKDSKFLHIIDKLKKMGSEKIYIIQKILKEKLSLSKEQAIYQSLLEIKDQEVYSMLSGAFKFKNLYLELLRYIYEEKIKDYQPKIMLLIENTIFEIGDNYKILPILFLIVREMHTQDDFDFLVEKIKKFFKKRNLKFLNHKGDFLPIVEYFIENDIEVLNLDKDFITNVL